MKIMLLIKFVACHPSKAAVTNLGSPDVLGLKLLEAFTASCAGQYF